MAFQPTQTRELNVHRVGPLRQTRKGNPFIECETDLGTVAFWGGRSMDNLYTIQRHPTPFRVRCGCRPPMENFPSHTLWVPEQARLEVLGEGAPQDAVAPAARALSESAASSSASVAAEDLVLYVVNCTAAKIWDEDPSAPAYVPAQSAYRGGTVREWLASRQCSHAKRWVFLSAKYGFIEPDHPISNYDVTFSKPETGPISDDALIAQVKWQRRFAEGILLSRFTRVLVWGSADYVQKARRAFESVGAVVEREA